ncbi:MAG: hypothetical protein ACOC46_00335 [Pirellulales bacterium]
MKICPRCADVLPREEPAWGRVVRCATCGAEREVTCSKPWARPLAGALFGLAAGAIVCPLVGLGGFDRTLLEPALFVLLPVAVWLVLVAE